MQTDFYTHVSKWIRSYYNPDSLDWLVKFVENSIEPDEVKAKLIREIKVKKSHLLNEACFTDFDGTMLLTDRTNNPVIYTTRYAAITKLAELTNKGYNVQLVEGNCFFRIEQLSDKKQEVPNV